MRPKHANILTPAASTAELILYCS